MVSDLLVLVYADGEKQSGCRGELMTALEYMEKQVKKNTINFEREFKRGAPEEVLCNIALKIHYYEEAVEALKGR